MRSVPSPMTAHLAGQATTICAAWRVTRRDGIALGFTDHDRPLVFGGTEFSPESGLSASEVESSLGLSVDGGEVAGAFSSSAIRGKDLRDGRFDGARVEHYAVNWAEPGQHLLLNVYEIGEVVSEDEAFRAELRGLKHRLEAVKGRVYAGRCDADLGDARCTVALDDTAWRGEGVVVHAVARSAVLATGLEAFSAGWFRHGLLTFETGENAGLSVEVLDHAVLAEGHSLSFWADIANPPALGDGFTVTAGCDKSFTACREKFSNGFNFRGFPHLPGSDFTYGYADGDTVHDGRPVVT